MEVDDIQSFFLNKDKKKKSKKINTINPALLLEKSREVENKKTKKVNERQQQNQEPQSDLLRKTKEDEDWEDTSEQEVDLASLRIGMMPTKTEVRPKVEVVEEEGSDDEDIERVEKQIHPWGSKSVNPTIVTPAVVAEPEVTESAQPKKYVVPSLRTSSGGVTPGQRAPKRVPNIGNSSEFPSLREAADIETEDSSWSRVTKNGHTEKSMVTTKKEVAPSIAVNTTASATTVDSKPQPNKYVPPSLRKAANRYDGLREENL